MKKYIGIAGIAVALTLGSCTESFFELTPNNAVLTEKLYVTSSDFNLAVMGCYAKMQTQNSFFIEMCEYRSDNIYLSAPTTGTQDRYDLDTFAEQATNGILESLWANFNNGVYRCNLVLDKIDEAEFDQDLKDQYKGEALFIRALTYFNMYRSWGGVPTTTTVVSVEEALQIGRSSSDEMYELIVGDLKSIVDGDLLPVSYDSSDLGRVTIGAARALLGKVYLTFEKWSEARDVLEPLATGSTYVLLDDIADVFSVSNKQNSEILFAIAYDKTIDGEGHGFWYSIANETDDNNQTDALVNAFEANDRRKDMITYVQAESSVWVMNKFYDTRDSFTQTVGNDMPILRYSDVLLMYAEALNEISHDGSSGSAAYAALNRVYKRSTASDYDPSALTTQDSFREAIMVERQREFPYEGQRWFDLVRMGAARSVIAANEGHTIAEWQFVYPIPNSEIERINNTSLLWQNPGY